MLVRPRDLMATFNEDGSILLRSTSRGVGVKAPAFASAVLAFCSKPRSPRDIEDALGPPAVAVYHQLAKLGLLVAPENREDTPVIFHNFAAIEIHRRMLSDERRLEAYRAGIRAVVRPGDVVIDAGSGTGILAIYAALAGARRVYAVERTEMAEAIEQIAADSGVADRVEVVRGDISTVKLPEKARILVTETYGCMAFAEGCMPEIMICAANNLEPDGVMVPEAHGLCLAPVAHAPALLRPFRRREDGVDLRSLRGDAEGRSMEAQVDPGQIGPITRFGPWRTPHDGLFEGVLSLSEPCDALCGWFDLYFPGGGALLMSPEHPPTHWNQSLIPLALEPGTYEVRSGYAPEDRRTMLLDIGGHEVRIR